MKAAHFSRQAMGKLMLYLPMLIMGVLALGSWWLARNTPGVSVAAADKLARTSPDYFLSQFSVKNFDAQGVLLSEVLGGKAKHFPDTNILEVEKARFHSWRGSQGTTGYGDRAYSNGDGSEIQLIGHAVVVRAAGKDAQGTEMPKIEFRSDFLHAFVASQELKTHKPVTVRRGADQFSGDSMRYNKIDGVVQLDGRVRVRLEAKSSTVR